MLGHHHGNFPVFRGRPIRLTSTQHLKKFYDLSSSDDEEEEKEDNSKTVEESDDEPEDKSEAEKVSKPEDTKKVDMLLVSLHVQPLYILLLTTC